MHKGGPDPIWSIPFCARKTGESMCKTEENPARGREKLAAFGYFSEDVFPNRVNNDCSKTLYSSQGSGLVTRCNIVRQASSFVLLWFSSPSNTKLLFAPRLRSSVRLIPVTPQEDCSVATLPAQKQTLQVCALGLSSSSADRTH